MTWSFFRCQEIIFEKLNYRYLYISKISDFWFLLPISLEIGMQLKAHTSKVDLKIARMARSSSLVYFQSLVCPVHFFFEFFSFLTAWSD